MQYIGAFWNGWPQNSFPGIQGPLRHWPRDATANGKNIFLMSDSRLNGISSLTKTRRTVLVRQIFVSKMKGHEPDVVNTGAVVRLT